MSNFEYKRERSIKEIPLEFSAIPTNLKESVHESIKEEEPEDFVIEPEINKKTVNVIDESTTPFGNDFSSEVPVHPVFTNSEVPVEPISKYRYKQKIFDESKEIYYREMKNEGLINYKNIGGKGTTQEKQIFELQSQYEDQSVPKRYIKASVE